MKRKFFSIFIYVVNNNAKAVTKIKQDENWKKILFKFPEIFSFK